MKLLAAFVALAAAPAYAQTVLPPDSAALAARLQAMQAAIPVPASTVPPSEAIGGTVGTAGTYRPADSAMPRITRAAVVTTDATGAWAVTWSSALASVPVVIPIAINSGALPISCNVVSRTASTASGKCWQAQSALVSLGLTLVPYTTPAAATPVQLVALPTTQ